MANYLSLLILLTVSGAGAPDRRLPGPLAPYLLDETHEIALARSAAPAAISTDAGIYVLRADGFARIHASQNGFECMVIRGFNDQGARTRGTATDPKILGPICYNPEAVRTELKLQLEKTTLVAKGLSAEQIGSALSARLASGELPTPTRVALAYMFSSAQWFGDALEHFHPHVMMWSPYLSASDVGALGGLPMPQLTDPGAPYALLAIPVPEWVHPVKAGGGVK